MNTITDTNPTLSLCPSLPVAIPDDFDADKIIASGQCFRCTRLADGTWRFLTQAGSPGRTHILVLRQLSPTEYAASCSAEEWAQIWTPYFDLDCSYQSIRDRVREDSFLSAAAEFGKGIRILRQDPWETLICFILSQRKSIPSIRNSVERLSERFGSPVQTDGGELRSFPTPEALRDADTEALVACGLGYRLPYVRDAAERFCRTPDLALQWRLLGNEDLLAALKQIHGVGNKIANCVMLFAYHRSSCAPIDTWIERIIEKEYGGCNPFPAYGEDAGILQQYAFFYAQRHKEDFR